MPILKMKHINKNRIFISILLVTLFYVGFTIFSDVDKIKNDYQNFNFFYFLPVLPILFISMLILAAWCVCLISDTSL